MLYGNRRTSDLPAHVLSSGIYYGGEPKELIETYWIATKGTRGWKGEKVEDPKELLRAAVRWVNYYLENGNLINSLVERIKSRNLPDGETVQICFAAAAQGSTVNIVPTVLADILKDRISEKLELSGKNLKIVTAPIYKLSKITAVDRFDFNPFEKLVARSVFDARAVTKNAIIVDDDNLTGMTVCEMASAALENRANVIAIATAFQFLGGSKFRIQESTLKALEDALTKNSGGIEHPVETFISELKTYGYKDGLMSLTNMEGLMLIAALLSPQEGSEKLPSIWEDSTGTGWKSAVVQYCRGETQSAKFPINRVINEPAINVRQAIEIMKTKYAELEKVQAEERAHER